MKATGELLLTFLLNACWQVMLIAAVVALGDLFLRRTVARYRHLLWVAALGLSLVLPLITSARWFVISAQATLARQETLAAPVLLADLPVSNTPAIVSSLRSAFQVSGRVAAGLLALYLIFLGYRAFGLSRAWARTQAAKRGASPFGPAHRIHAIVANCHRAIGVARVRTMSSNSLSAPATVGIFRPLIILPEALARNASDEELTAAVGHELVHVRRRDYLLNLVYEFIFLPLSFHPAAALMRRRITQTRELRCDELVTELLLRPEVYARSLVQLVRSAMPLAHRARTVAVGIADADILEARIMSLMGRTKLSTRRSRIFLIAALVLLGLPCAAAASFPLHVNVSQKLSQEPERVALNEKERKARLIYHTEPEYTEDARAKNIEGKVGLSITVGTDGVVRDVEVTKPLYPSLDQSAIAAARNWRFEPYMKDGQPAPKQFSVEVYFSPQQDKRAREERELKERAEREDQELKERIEKETNQEVKAKLEAELFRRQEGRAKGLALTTRDGETVTFAIDGEGARREREQEAKRQAELARLAKISMEQAIQIAISQSPGKVLACSLVGERWEGPGELSKPSLVLYHVVILGDESKPATHVLVNALDGTIFRTSREERRSEAFTNRAREERAISGGTLNDKAVNLPAPEYPAIARAAHAGGTVTVEILVDEGGKVVAAHAVSGHPLLQAAAVTAARQAEFTQTRLSGEPVKVKGLLTYNFVAQ